MFKSIHLQTHNQKLFRVKRNHSKELRLYKLLNPKMKHHGFQYNPNGLNIDHNPFYTGESCSPGGLYFFNEAQLIDHKLYFLDDPYWICSVKIPNGALVHHEDGKSKASGLFLYNCEKFQPNNVIKYINFNNPKVCSEIVKQDHFSLKYIKKQTPTICLESVRFNAFSIRFVKRQTNKLCMMSLLQYGSNLQFVKKQTPKLSLAAVQQNGLALEFVKEQTEEICLAAVQQNGLALEFVKDQTPEICMMAIQQNPQAIKFTRYRKIHS